MKTRLYMGYLSLVLLLAASGAHAAEAGWNVTVEAGATDRNQTPVKVLVQVPETEKAATIVSLSPAGQGGEPLVGQLTMPGVLAPVVAGKRDPLQRELHFILPSLKAGANASYTAKIVASDSSAKQFAWKDTPGKQMDLTFGDRSVLRYMYERVDNSNKDRRGETFKVYHHLFDPQGERLVTKGPGGLFPHHRGVYFGFNRISYDGQSADVWHCNNGESQTHEGFLLQEAGPVLARHTLDIAWRGKVANVLEKKELGAIFAKEKREITVYNTPGGLMMSFATRLETTGGKVRLDGDPQHAGVHFRASQEVPDKTAKKTYYVRPDGQAEPGKFRNWPNDKAHVNLAWNALSFVLGEQRYTCCYLDRPENPKESRFSERDYGRFGSYFEYDLDAEHPLELNYRFWLQEGEMTVAAVAAKSADFVAPPVVGAR
ncbi:MAG TPA: DUF6807 family protein [Pirellulaceae bacterium]|nr:DUF6807 family protein [Pirellulaceae bacterium]